MKSDNSETTIAWRSITTPIALVAVCLVVITATTIGIFQYNQNYSSRIAREQERLDFALEKSNLQLQDIREDAVRNVLTLAGTPPLQGMIRARQNGGYDPLDQSTEQMWKDRLAQIFLSLAQHDTHLLQIRLIEADGKELVRINSNLGTAVRVPESELQDKGARDYVLDTLSKPENSVTVFGFDLNREFGEIEVPYQPVLRAATPIHDAEGGVFGLIVVNVNATSMFRELVNVTNRGHDFYLTDSEGAYILHPEIAKRYSRDLGVPSFIQTDYPELSSFFKKRSTDAHSIRHMNGGEGSYLASIGTIALDPGSPDNYLVMASVLPMEALMGENMQMAQRIVMVAATLALLSAVLAMLAARSLTRPLRKLTAAANKLSEGTAASDLQVPETRDDEIGTLTRTFHDMARTLQERQERLQAILETANNPIISIDSRGTIQEVNNAATILFGFKKSEMVGQNVKMLMGAHDQLNHNTYLSNYLMRNEKALGRCVEVEGVAKDGSHIPLHLSVSEIMHKGQRHFTAIFTDLTELKKVEKLKDEFVSTVSHELRTPLTSIKGSLGLLRGSILGELPDQMKAMVEIAFNNSDRLVRLINDILDIEKMEAGALSFHFEDVNLSELLERAVDNNRGFALELDVVIALQPVDESFVVNADQDRLEQVLANLLSNAAKYSPQGGIVEVTAVRRRDAVRISVTDHGKGVPESFQDKIFDKFAQADSSNTRNPGGTGLGLAISKEIVEQHTGQIGYKTQRGEGTTFFFDLPLVLSEELIDEDTTAEPIAEEDGHRILICEDEPDMAGLLALLAKDLGFKTEICATATQAREALRKREFAAMTLDLNLPDQDGLLLFRDLRANLKTRDLPVLVVSARHVNEDETPKGTQFGPIEWLEKPLNIDRLQQGIVRSLTANHTPHLRVLCIDDDAEHVGELTELVGPATTVDVVQTCKDARHALEDADYDLVMLDLLLPDGHGESLLPFIHANGSFPPQVIVFSNNELPASLVAKVDAAIVEAQTSKEMLRRQIKALLERRESQMHGHGNPEERSFAQGGR